MTQEERKVLLKDLCGRLPYGVKVKYYSMEYPYGSEPVTLTPHLLNDRWENVQDVKPYLRPMSSMSEEEKRELSVKYNWYISGNDISIRYHSEGYWDDDTECPTNEYLELFDWLKTHHFDYRGLIPMGLALEAPEDMYDNLKK